MTRVGLALYAPMTVAFLLFSSVQSPTYAQFYVDTGQQLGLILYLPNVIDGSPVPNIDLGPYVQPAATQGGHLSGHNPQKNPNFMGGFTTNGCNTGSNGMQCYMVFSANAIGGAVTVKALIQSGPQNGQTMTMADPINIGALSGYDLPLSLVNYGSPYFALVGQTGIHPDNHYCQTDVCDNALQLAIDYNTAHGLTLAYNDAALIKGGVFDVTNGGNWNPPHNTHRTGRNIDVRANSEANAIPRGNNTIRNWFTTRVQQLFGSAPLHEDAGQPNEHYHIIS